MIKEIHVYLIMVAVSFLGGGILVNVLLAVNTHPNSSPQTGYLATNSISESENFTAEEIYKMFICSCCGSTIDAMCCGMAKEMVAYVDAMVDAGLSKTDVILKTVKKYGIDTVVEEKQEEIRLELAARAPAERPEIVITSESYDFGDVSQAEGTVSSFFTIKNEGTTDLIIEAISTSCGCTTASLEGSDFFGMAGHGGGIDASPPDWTYTLPPGSTAELEVKYDPNMHGELRGPVTRSVFITSNDPINFKEEVRIELNQVA
jgi:cytochrome c-type biogenesis protein CcmH/NrfF